MFILFGTKRFNKNYGVTYKIRCSVCNNEKYHQFILSSIWFHVFFIPVLPLSIRYYNICPVCNNINYIKGKNKKKYRDLAVLNTDFSNGKISEEEYRENISLIENP
jgi:uncharacterized membrane protein